MEELKFYIDGKEVTAPEGSTILQAARLSGIDIPALCFYEGLSPKASCRLCQVKIEGEERTKLACAAKVKEGMHVTSESDELFAIRKSIVQDIFRQHTVDCHHCLRIGSTKAEHFDPAFCESCFFCDCVRDGFCELQDLALRFGIDVLPFEIREHDFGMDCSAAPVIRNMDKCVNCRRCIDICKLQGVGILGLREKENGKIVSAEKGMMHDGCIRCGRCVDVCPTGALFMQENKDEIIYDTHQYDTVTAALLMYDVVEPLRKLYGEAFSYEQVAAALFKIGVDHVYDGASAIKRSHDHASAILDSYLGTKKLIITDNYAAKSFLESKLGEFSESFAFYDSPQKVFADAVRKIHPEAILIAISSDNSTGAESVSGNAADFFVNPRELYRMLMRTGGAPSKRIPCDAEVIDAEGADDCYKELLAEYDRNLSAAPKEVGINKAGRIFKGVICHNLRQLQEMLQPDKDYDVIRVLL